MYLLVMCMFFAIPIASLIFFVSSLISFCTAKRQNKRSPGSYNENENIPILIDWILSDEGQTIIENTGYVGIS